MSTINSTNANIQFSVGPIGIGLYQTIQSAITAAEAAGGGTVVINSGLYSENLVFSTGTVQLLGFDSNTYFLGAGGFVVIIGTHTPPPTGLFSASNIYFETSTDLFSSSAASAASVVLEDCNVEVDNGYIFNLPNWVGPLVMYNVQDNFSTNNGIVNNTGGSPITIENSKVGTGTGNSMVTTSTVFIQKSEIGCPISLQTATIFTFDTSTFSQTVTIANNSTGSFTFCKLSTGSTAALTMSSSGAVNITSCVIDSTNSPSITGASGGILSFGDVTFLNDATQSVLLTVSGVGGYIPGAFGSASQVLTSNGLGSAPSFQSPAGGSVTITGDSGSVSGSSLTLTGGTSGAVFTGSSTTLTESFNFLALPATTSTNGQITINGSAAFHAAGGSTNIFVGGSGNFTTTGTNNVAVGYLAMPSIAADSLNVAVGYGALNALTGSIRSNVAVGAESMGTLVTGNNNAALGYLSGSAFTSSESNNVCIQSTGVVGDSTTLRIGNGTGTGERQLNKAFISGIQGITVTGAAVLVSSSDQLGVAVSSARFKDNIQDMGSYSSDILKLRPTTFNYNVGDDHSLQGGLIAEEVQEIMPSLVVLDKEGLPQTVKYHDLPALLLNELQKAVKRIEVLEAKLAERD